jgi:CBS domain-containing protein
MTPQVVVLKDKMLLKEAVRLLRQAGHSGGPVVNDEGKLVGTISVRDILGTSKKIEGGKGKSPPVDVPISLANELLTSSGTWMMWDNKPKDELEDDLELVKTRMRKDVNRVGEHSLLIEAARIMCTFHSHRVPVVDVVERLVGIITPIDILAAMVNAADEQG